MAAVLMINGNTYFKKLLGATKARSDVLLHRFKGARKSNKSLSGEDRAQRRVSCQLECDNSDNSDAHKITSIPSTCLAEVALCEADKLAACGRPKLCCGSQVKQRPNFAVMFTCVNYIRHDRLTSDLCC
jgi:hypothetical protein